VDDERRRENGDERRQLPASVARRAPHGVVAQTPLVLGVCHPGDGAVVLALARPVAGRSAHVHQARAAVAVDVAVRVERRLHAHCVGAHVPLEHLRVRHLTERLGQTVQLLGRHFRHAVVRCHVVLGLPLGFVLLVRLAQVQVELREVQNLETKLMKLLFLQIGLTFEKSLF